MPEGRARSLRWAALVCRIAQALGRPVGLLQPALHALAAKGSPTEGFRDVSHGDNGAYRARVGWDPCTGLGVPVGSALLALLKERYGEGDTSGSVRSDSSARPR